MPRIARVKMHGAIYHIMARSISEVDLFKTDEDRKKYMFLIKEYQEVYNFKVYAYCLMKNHVHLIIDSNGADISKIMHCINFKYARYFNTRHKRHGHLFQDRFKSKIVEDDRYLIALSAYIHNNPLDIRGYEDCPEKYYYSSLAVYLGLRNDKFDILDKEFILSLFGESKDKSRKTYMSLVLRTRTIPICEIIKEEIEFKEEKTEYRSERKILVRNFSVDKVIEYVVDKFKIDKTLLYLKHQKEIVPARGILVLILRNLCNASCKDICGILGNITSSRVSKLSSIGVKLISDDERYSEIINEFIACYC
ncbi:transposase [Clostridium swellfunianum]|uniref:transposase n=1 Tax=Clostridium swellfunianum TaxID=1367462 RepID=UPI00202F50D1|nr:transposase [Clostridium swellfunianum]MCM0650009.1 transposase [Clostridium swellfunianum]